MKKPQSRTWKENNQEANNLNSLYLGIAIAKRIGPYFKARCDKSSALTYSVGGTKLQGVYKEMRTFRENDQQTAVTNIIIHFGTNHFPRDQPNNTTSKISKLLLHATKEFSNTSICFSVILLAFKNTFFYKI